MSDCVQCGRPLVRPPYGGPDSFCRCGGALVKLECDECRLPFEPGPYSTDRRRCACLASAPISAAMDASPLDGVRLRADRIPSEFKARLAALINRVVLPRSASGSSGSDRPATGSPRVVRKGRYRPLKVRSRRSSSVMVRSMWVGRKEEVA